jgi:thiamine biosynthesis lipoprotein ApbE
LRALRSIVVSAALARWMIGVLLVPLIGGATPAQRAYESHEYRYVMGTSVQVQASGGDEATRRTAIDEAFAAFDEVDRLMSNYRDDSELALINRSAARGVVSVSDPMFGVLDAARRVSSASQGAFDITVGPLVRLWGFHDKKPHVPTDAELATVRTLVDYRNVLLDAEHHTVRFARRASSSIWAASPKASPWRLLPASCDGGDSAVSSTRAAINTCWGLRRASGRGTSGSRIPMCPTV